MKNEINRIPIIVLTDREYYQPTRVDELLKRIAKLGELRLVGRLNEEQLIDRLQDADVAVVRRDGMTLSVFSACPHLLGVIKMGAGYDQIDIPAATEQGVIVAYSPGVTIGVAEAALMLMISLSRPFFELVEIARRGELPPSDARGIELYGKTLGIVGFGRIGSHMARIAYGIGMQVIVYNRHPENVQDFETVSLKELLKRADFVSLHTPLTPETRHLIDEQALKLMKPSAYLVNTARGAVVDTAALITALDDGWIAGAGLDVVEGEPIPADHPLLTMPNVILTPHALGRSWEALGRVMGIIERSVVDILAGRLPQYTLNPEVVRKPSPFTK